MTEPTPLDEMEATIRENEAQDPNFYRDPNAPKPSISSNTFIAFPDPYLDAHYANLKAIKTWNERTGAAASNSVRASSSSHFLGYPLTAEERAQSSVDDLEDWVK